ncbi:MAG: barstar family protein [Bacteroidetes bacterium]|nr:barstar family protein [Bacteroidota bacterium]
MSKIYQLQHQGFISEASDTYVAILDGRKMKTMAEFYAVLSEALQFPDYFGANLDALDELLFEIDWLPSQFVLLIIHHHQNLLENEVAMKDEIWQLLNDIDNPYFEVCRC